MAKILNVALLITIGTIGYFQYERILNPHKEVVYHHYEECTKTSTSQPIMAFEAFSDTIIAATINLVDLFNKGAGHVKEGKLQEIRVLENKVETIELEIQNFPQDIAFYPFALHVEAADELYVLNHGFHKGGTRIEKLKLTEGQKVGVKYQGTIFIPQELQGKIGDFIIFDDKFLYLTQYSDVPMSLDDKPSSFFNYIKMLLYDIFQVKSAYIYRCSYELNKTAECSKVPDTQAVSITGITKTRFEDVIVSFASIDYNKIVYYKVKEKTGELDKKSTIPIRDRTERLTWDKNSQRVYAGSVPWTHNFLGEAPVPSAAIEIRRMDFGMGLNYRRLFTQENLLRGGSAAISYDQSVLLGSYLEPAFLTCPIIGYNNQAKVQHFAQIIKTESPNPSLYRARYCTLSGSRLIILYFRLQFIQQCSSSEGSCIRRRKEGSRGIPFPI